MKGKAKAKIVTQVKGEADVKQEVKKDTPLWVYVLTGTTAR